MLQKAKGLGVATTNRKVSRGLLFVTGLWFDCAVDDAAAASFETMPQMFSDMKVR